MLNISKYYQSILGCSALATALATLASSTSAQTVPVRVNQPVLVAACEGGCVSAPMPVTNGSNASGSNVTTITSPSVSPSNAPGGASSSGFSAPTVSRAGVVSTRFNTAQAAYDRAAAALAQAETAQPNAANSSPVRYGREPGDLASCGCPNADTVGTNTTARPELVAAKAAEAEAAAELAKAKAEAREFIESVKNEPKATASSGSIQIW